jgi:phosphotriesterase-related protein
VRGLIEPDQLGPTLMHEHVLTDYTPPSQRGRKPMEITLENHFELSYHRVDHPGMRDLSDSEVATREMRFMIESGGRSVVDVSTRAMILYPKQMQEVSERSGAQIIMECGRYYDDEGFFNEKERARSVEDLAREFINEICIGIGGTTVKAGIIGEIGCSCPWHQSEQRSM